MILSLDTEDTGTDFRHGSRPFFVTTCTDEGIQRFYDWRVDPFTRAPEIPQSDVREIQSLIESADTIVGQNFKFDLHALRSIGIEKFDWSKLQDTLIASHVLASNQPHNLTDLVMHYLGKDIYPLEERLQKAVEECRRKCRLKSFIDEHGKVALASQDREDMPSASGQLWRLDYWLPKTVARMLDLPKDHLYWSVLSDYSNADSMYTLLLWNVLEQELRERGYWEVYREKMESLVGIWSMEDYGVSFNSTRLAELRDEFSSDRDDAEKVCLNIAESFGFDLKMPKGASPNNSLRSFCFDVMKLKPIIPKKAKSNAPSLNKEVMAEYVNTLSQGSRELLFVKTLLGKRARDTAIGYMNSYESYGIREEKDPFEKCWLKLHPNLNPTGTSTTRLSCSNPNGQNIAKEKEFEGGEEPLPSIRYLFGPLPGREWYSNDYENIELRIPAYVARESAMIELFEKPDEAPYFGSYHLLRASIFYPELFWPVAEKKGEFKRLYPNKYHRTKIAGFALNYQAGAATVDAATGRPGSHAAIKDKLPLVNALNVKVTAFANKHGYIETMPNLARGRTKGYPLLCTRSERGGILPTVPLSYFVQGTAGDCMVRAITRVRAFYDGLNSGAKFQGRLWKGGYHLVLTIHDELISDCPKFKDPKHNIPVMLEVKRLMSFSGDDIGVPLKVSVSYHPHCWSEEVDLAT